MNFKRGGTLSRLEQFKADKTSLSSANIIAFSSYKLLCEGKLGVSRLISGSYPLRQKQKAFDKLAKGVGIKYAIIP
jgi:Zn-dependent alcohol dehydrogenase